MPESEGPQRNRDGRAFEGAKEKLRVARGKLDEMRAANQITKLARLWEEILTVQQQIFLRLRKAFEHGPSKAWSDSITNDQRSDAMLQYVMHARNANEHGIDNIIETRHSRLKINPNRAARHCLLTIFILIRQGLNLQLTTRQRPTRLSRLNLRQLSSYQCGIEVLITIPQLAILDSKSHQVRLSSPS
jgi:hypothetical protein